MDRHCKTSPPAGGLASARVTGTPAALRHFAAYPQLRKSVTRPAAGTGRSIEVVAPLQEELWAAATEQRGIEGDDSNPHQVRQLHLFCSSVHVLESLSVEVRPSQNFVEAFDYSSVFQYSSHNMSTQFHSAVWLVPCITQITHVLLAVHRILTQQLPVAILTHVHIAICSAGVTLIRIVTQGEVDLVGSFFELEQRLQTAAAAAARAPNDAPAKVQPSPHTSAR